PPPLPPPPPPPRRRPPRRPIFFRLVPHAAGTDVEVMSENATARVLAALPPGALLEECLVGLRAGGHVVEVAGSPALALARVEESDWDLVLMDSLLAIPGSLALLEGV